MVKNCCAVGCTKVYQKGSGISFYRFPTNVERKRRWIATVRRENWMPSKYSWICSQQFVTGKKSNNPLAPNYVPSVFEHVDSPVKHRLENEARQFERRQAMKKRRWTAARKATTLVLLIGTRRLCWHNFERNRYLKALSIMPA